MRTAAGCLAYLVVFAALTFWLDRWTAERIAGFLRPWVGAAAALCFTLAGATVAHWLGSRLGGQSRSALLARAATGTTPATDGPTIATGTVRASTDTLHAPISGTPCVAYMYRMYFEQHLRNTARKEHVPVYWGVASRPFLLDTPSQAVRILAAPQLVVPPTSHRGPEAVRRATDWVAATEFEPTVPNPLGTVGSAMSIVGTMMRNDTGAQRRDWCRSGDARDPATLILEEIVLEVGATASVAGRWSVERRAIVAGPAATDGPGVVVTTEPADTLLDRHAAMPHPTLRVWTWAIALAALGAGVLWLAPRLPR